MFESSDIWLAIVGLLGGIIAGFVGLGGGILFVVVLPYFLVQSGISSESLAPYIVANSLFATFASSVSANITLYRLGKFRLKPIVIIALAASVVSSLMIRFVVIQPWFSAQVFNGLLLVLLFATLLRTLFYKEQKDELRTVDQLKLQDMTVVGFVTGIIQPLSGLGGGVIMIPMLNTLERLNIKDAANLSIGVVGLTSMVNAISMAQSTIDVKLSVAHTGYLVWPIALMLSVGVMIGAPIGVKLAQTLSSRIIRITFVSLMLAVIGVKAVELVTQMLTD